MMIQQLQQQLAYSVRKDINNDGWNSGNNIPNNNNNINNGTLGNGYLRSVPLSRARRTQSRAPTARAAYESQLGVLANSSGHRIEHGHYID